MSAFRLVEHFRTGPRTYRPVFDTVDAAVAYADRVFDALAGSSRCPWRIDVIDMTTGEPVARVLPHRDRDAALCVACGQPLDPFAQGGAGTDGVGSPQSLPGPAPSDLPERGDL